MRYIRMSGFVAVAWLVFACGGAPVPQERLTASEAAVRAAEAGGAPAIPKAALHLKQARDQIEQAKALIAEDENEHAEIVLQRAEVDAELALALAQEHAAQQEAQEALEQVQELRSKRK